MQKFNNDYISGILFATLFIIVNVIIIWTLMIFFDILFMWLTSTRDIWVWIGWFILFFWTPYILNVIKIIFTINNKALFSIVASMQFWILFYILLIINYIEKINSPWTIYWLIPYVVTILVTLIASGTFYNLTMQLLYNWKISFEK